MGSGFIDVFNARDLSNGGLSLIVPHRFEGCNLAGEVEVLLKLPGLKPFVVRGLVRHTQDDTDGTAFGIEFTRLDATAKSRINAYVDELAALGRCA
jgi:hypothetical protein